MPQGADDATRQLALASCLGRQTSTTWDFRLRREVDVLFMIDNSSSMTPKQRVLAQAIPKFIQRIDATGADYHIGVITSDIGTLPPGGGAFPGQNDPSCATPSGDDGLLQARPCTSRMQNPTQEFTQACASLCPDSSFVPSDRFIAKTNGVHNISGHAGDPTAPQKAFQCIGLVGDAGCGVEGQLESARRSLDGHRSENSGFLRNDSVLAVIFITDEDDCSVQLAQRANLSPLDMSCDPSNPDPAYGCYNLDYRCLAKDIACNEPLDAPGAKTGCKERTDTFLDPIEKHARFYASLRSSDKLVLAGIWSPSLTGYYNRNSTGDGQLVVESAAPPDNSTNRLNRGQKLSAACYNPDPNLTSSARGFFGQAQLRLSSFLGRFDPSVTSEQSICDAANYPAALDGIARQIELKSGPACLPGRPRLTTSGEPACLVGFVDATQPAALPDEYLPVCSAGCCQGWASAVNPSGNDAGVQAACAAETRDCFCATPSSVTCTQTAVSGVWRVGNAEPPPGKVVSFRCAAILPSTAAL